MKIQRLKNGKLRDAATGKILKDAFNETAVMAALRTLKRNIGLTIQSIPKENVFFPLKREIQAINDMIDLTMVPVAHADKSNAQSGIRNISQQLNAGFSEIKKLKQKGLSVPSRVEELMRKNDIFAKKNIWNPIKAMDSRLKDAPDLFLLTKEMGNKLQKEVPYDSVGSRYRGIYHSIGMLQKYAKQKDYDMAKHMLAVIDKGIVEMNREYPEVLRTIKPFMQKIRAILL